MKDFRNLRRGSIVRHKDSSVSYVVTDNYGSHVTAVRTIDLQNPDEWLDVSPKAASIPPDKKWCMCTKLEGVARDGFSTCSTCGGKDAYGRSPLRPPEFLKKDHNKNPTPKKNCL